MNKIIQLEQQMRDFLIQFDQSFARFQNPTPQEDMQMVANEQSNNLSMIAQGLSKTITELKQIDQYTEEQINEQTEKVFEERKLALQQYKTLKKDADLLNKNLKDNIDTLASKLYNLNE